jgi:predicted dithiol-disulfide oxidoreductase (DUF899 family)
MSLPQIASRDEWRKAREELLVKEKAATRARDALNAERRRLPMVEIDKDYRFDGPDGGLGMLEMFEGRLQLVIYHAMFDPEWDLGCRSCSAFMDQIGHLVHLHVRNTTFAVVSRAPLAKITPFKQRMGWTMPWYSSYGSDFNYDFDATRDDGEYPAMSAFLRDGDRVFHTYSTQARGLDGVASVSSILDLTALGRQEEWEEPKDRAKSLGLQAGGPEMRYRDEY